MGFDAAERISRWAVVNIRRLALALRSMYALLRSHVLTEGPTAAHHGLVSWSLGCRLRRWPQT